MGVGDRYDLKATFFYYFIFFPFQFFCTFYVKSILQGYYGNFMLSRKESYFPDLRGAL